MRFPAGMRIVLFVFVGSVAGGSILSKANTISSSIKGVMRMLHIRIGYNRQRTYITVNIAPGHGSH